MELNQYPIKEKILANIMSKGFTTPTEIQQKAWPVLLEKAMDFVGLAQTGTGKTAAFVIPMLEKIDESSNELQVLILAPTRELVSQVYQEIADFSKGTKIRSNVVYGGMSIMEQMRNYKNDRPQVLVASPGRLIDLINRKVVKLDHIKLVILDEADEMLSQGFIDDIDWVLQNTPKEKNIWLFSATMSDQVKNLQRKYLKDPMMVSVQKNTNSKPNIAQSFYVVKPRKKIQALTQLLITLGDYYGMVFCNTKIEAKKVCDELNSIGVPADALHGDIVQAQRDITMKKFKERKIRLLVCTDVAARGIDVQDLTHVFNYDLPQELESYVHRIGRTGRAGKEGAAIAFVYESELFKIRRLEKILNATIEKKKFLTEKDVKGSLIKAEIERFENSFGKQKVEEDADFNLFLESIQSMDEAEMKKWLYLSVIKTKIVKFHLNESVQDDFSSRGSRERSGGGDFRPRFGDRRGGGRSFGGDRRGEDRRGERTSDRGFSGGRSFGGDRGERSFTDRPFTPRSERSNEETSDSRGSSRPPRRSFNREGDTGSGAGGGGRPHRRSRDFGGDVERRRY